MLCVSAFLLLDLEDAWRLCCFWGGRSAPRWKEERVLVGAEALHFKPYKISDAPQSQTSNRQRVVERRRTGWSWVERIWLSVLRASRAGCCSEVSRRVAEQKHDRKILYTRFISFGRWHVSEEGNRKFLFCSEVRRCNRQDLDIENHVLHFFFEVYDTKMLRWGSGKSGLLFNLKFPVVRKLIFDWSFGIVGQVTNPKTASLGGASKPSLTTCSVTMTNRSAERSSPVAPPLPSPLHVTQVTKNVKPSVDWSEDELIWHRENLTFEASKCPNMSPAVVRGRPVHIRPLLEILFPVCVLVSFSFSVS